MDLGGISEREAEMLTLKLVVCVVKDVMMLTWFDDTKSSERSRPPRTIRFYIITEDITDRKGGLTTGKKADCSNNMV